MTTSTVNGVFPGSSSPAAPGTTSGSASASSGLGISQTDFLTLITTQMQDQNPLDPTDPNQFLSQIEGLSEVSSMQSMQSALQSSQVMSGTSLLGRTVLAAGTTATLATGGSVTGAVEAPAGATNLQVTVQNASGATVSTFNVAPQASGLTSFSWNGLTSSGAAAPAGQYSISISATVNGSSQSATPLLQSQVASVTLDPTTQAIDLNTGNGTVPLSSVVSVM